MGSRTSLIDRKFLEKLERLAIRWQKSLPGLVGGNFPSRQAGPGQEFLDHRQFHYGDDLRAVNWRAYLRFEKLFLKMFHIEPRVPVRLLLDTSLSMATGGGAKFDYGRRLAAALSYVGLLRHDTVAILPFSDGLGEAFLCSGGRHRFGPAAEYLEGLRCAGRTRFAGVAREFTARYAQRGLLVLISDFLDDEGFERPLELLGGFGHELMLIQLWDPEDREPYWTGPLALQDAETGRTLEIDVDGKTRSAYTQAFDAYARSLERAALSTGGRYLGVPTSQPLEEAIFAGLTGVGGLA